MGECGRLESRSWDDIRVMGILKKCFNSSLLFGFPLTESSKDLNHCLVVKVSHHSSCGLVLSSSVTNLEGERGHDGALLQSLSLLSASLASDIITASNLINIWNYLF